MEMKKLFCMLQMTLLFVPSLQGYNVFLPDWQQSMSLSCLCFCSSLVHIALRKG